MPEEELRTLRTLKFIMLKAHDKLFSEEDLKQAAINHIKHMRREDRDIYWANIDEKSAIPWIKDFFNISEEDLKNGGI